MTGIFQAVMTQTISMALAASWLMAGAAVGAQALLTRTFDTDKIGALPPGFTLASYRQSDPGRWLVRGPAAAQAHVVHLATPGATGYAMALADASTVENQVASIRLRLAGGARSGGLVWRYRDVQNFYAAVLDLTEGDLSLFRVSSGDLIRLEFEDGLELDVNAWHTLKVTHDDEEISVSLGGIRVFEDSRRRNRTGGPGAVGLLATGDSEVWFDDLRVDRRR
jgi:hypothetical protein